MAITTRVKASNLMMGAKWCKGCFCNFESILREITKGFLVYSGSLKWKT
jgi:hypothetical protein